MLRLALLGCGGIVRLAHLPSLRQIAGARVVAVADADATRREEARRLAPEARAYADYRDALASSDVDAVLIALPTGMHGEAALAAVEHGKHFYLEKPLATSVAEGVRVVEAWSATSLTAMMGLNYRRNPLVLRARDAIRSGAIGELVATRTVFSTTARAAPEWKARRDTGGGVLLDLGVHHFDLLRFLLAAEVAEVSAELRGVRFEDDTVLVRLGLTSGSTVQSFFSLSSVEEDRLEVYGTAGKLTLDRYASLRAEVTPPGARGALGVSLRRALAEWTALPYALRRLRAPGQEPSYLASLDAFVRAAAAGAPVDPDPRDGLRALEIVAAAEASARAGMAVALGSPVALHPQRPDPAATPAR